MGNQALLLGLARGREGLTISLKKSLCQLGILDPIPVCIAGEVGSPHIPTGKFECIELPG
jgi:hypothetical protein